MAEKGCDEYLAYVRDVSIDTPTVESIPVLRNFLDVFPADLPGSGSYTVCCDASRIGIGAMLKQNSRVIAYASRQLKALANQFVKLDISDPSRVLACVVSQSSLYDRIGERRYDDPHLLVLKDTVQHGDAKEVTIVDDDILRMQGMLCVPNVDGLRELILQEAHSSRYSIHPGVAKLYQDLRQHYWWRRMKKDIVKYVAWYLNCQQVKYECQRPDGLLKKLEIPE
ncbi:uncharacterized protein [Nicotiana tomentosiformis]|uniref:uncharacterized protein n=1 Tax=Nicotiana tomentosiformis TaxID=4098 RepID=UPI00388C4F58